LTVALVLAVLAAATLAGAAVALGTTAAGPPAKEIAKLKRKVAALEVELAKLRAGSPAAIRKQLDTVKADHRPLRDRQRRDRRRLRPGLAV